MDDMTTENQLALAEDVVERITDILAENFGDCWTPRYEYLNVAERIARTALQPK